MLVMDDEGMIRDIAAAMLSHLGYEVTTCAGGSVPASLAAVEATLRSKSTVVLHSAQTSRCSCRTARRSGAVRSRAKSTH